MDEIKGTRNVYFQVDSSALNSCALNTIYGDKYTTYESIMNTLFDLLDSVHQSDKEKELLAQDILLGRAEFTGSTVTNDLSITTYNVEDYDKIPNELFHYILQLKKENHDLKEIYNKYIDLCDGMIDKSLEYVKYNENKRLLIDSGVVISSSMESNAVRDLNSMFNPLVSDYLNHFHNEQDDDYGWLKPDGTFIPVEWALHQEWASDFLEQNDDLYQEFRAYQNDSIENMIKINTAGDFLVYRKHWCLLHSPMQGTARPTFDTIYGLTKKQKEFLYDYYCKRENFDLANCYYDD